MMYINRTTEEQEIIRKAYDFEVEAIRNLSNDRNPYFEDLKRMGIWEAFNEAVEMAFN